MLYELTKDIAQLIGSKGQPANVRFGPERVTKERFPGQVLVIEHDPAGDQLVAPQGMQRNPRKVRDRWIGALARIWARSSLPGAHRGDHKRECEKLIDAFTVATLAWATAAKVPGGLPFSSMRYLTSQEVAALNLAQALPGAAQPQIDVWPGVVYEIKFRVGRGVFDRQYVAEENPGAAQPTGTPADVAPAGGPVHVLKPDETYEVAP